MDVLRLFPFWAKILNFGCWLSHSRRRLSKGTRSSLDSFASSALHPPFFLVEKAALFEKSSLLSRLRLEGFSRKREKKERRVGARKEKVQKPLLLIRLESVVLEYGSLVLCRSHGVTIICMGGAIAYRM